MLFRSALAASSLGIAVLLGACGVELIVGDAGDCTPHRVEVPGAASAAPPAVRLASSCHRIVRVEGRETWYILQGEVTLTDEAAASLQPAGRITHANDWWAPRLQSADDLQTWAIEGYDPALAFWGTAADLRGTNTYGLWTIDDCSEVDACEPPICDLLDPDALTTRERCGGASM